MSFLYWRQKGGLHVKTFIGQNIKTLRKRAGLTQEQLAQRLFVTRQTVSQWELGRTRPDVETLQKVADCFQVDLLTVLYGAEQPQAAKWKTNLIRWGCVTAAIALAGRIPLKWIGRVSAESFNLPVYRVYVWLRLWGVPLIMLCCGIWLGQVLKPLVPKRRSPLWWGGTALRLAPAVLYVAWWIWSVPIPLSMIYVYMMQESWIFLLLGCGLDVSIRGGRGANVGKEQIPPE